MTTILIVTPSTHSILLQVINFIHNIHIIEHQPSSPVYFFSIYYKYLCAVHVILFCHILFLFFPFSSHSFFSK